MKAAVSVNRNPDELSFVHAVRVLQRHLPMFAISPWGDRAACHQAILLEILQEKVKRRLQRRMPRGVKRKMTATQSEIATPPLSNRLTSLFSGDP